MSEPLKIEIYIYIYINAGYLQDVVNKLSKVGQAIENNDLSTASSVLGGSTNTDWVQKANIAFDKVKNLEVDGIFMTDFSLRLYKCCHFSP